MSQEAVPEHAAREASVPSQEGAPKGLLQQMEELMDALNADLSQLDADLAQPATHRPGEDTQDPGGAARQQHGERPGECDSGA